MKEDFFSSANNNSKLKQSHSDFASNYSGNQNNGPIVNESSIDLIIEANAQGEPQNAVGQIYFSDNKKIENEAAAVVSFFFVYIFD